MTISEYLQSNCLLTALPVINSDSEALPGVVGVIGFSSEQHRECVCSEIESTTDSSSIPALFASTGENILELVPFGLVDDICAHPACIKDSEELFFEMGRLYFHGLLVY